MAGVPRESHEALYRSYVEALQRRWPRFRLVRKTDSRLCRWIDRALRLLTGGRQSAFMDRYVTTLGHRVYVPADWERAVPPGQRYCTLRHEAVHVRQFRRLTFPGLALVYLFLPLPFGFAAGRALVEWAGYRETLAATWQVYGPDAARDPALHDEIVRRFTGPDYVWMWVRGRTVRRAIARTLASLEAAPPPPLVVPDPEAQP
ncbi:MAG: hypothetical protein ACQEXJ_10815 [Myxococcota bacterium]